MIPLYESGTTNKVNLMPHHWHTAMEVIMPVENYYDVITASNSYHIEPGEILVIPSGEMHQLIAPGKRHPLYLLI